MSESIQKKLLKVRPPRVKITYDLETEGAFIAKELPVMIGVIGDFSGMRDENLPFVSYKDRQFIYFNSQTFNENLKSLRPRVLIKIPIYNNQNNDKTVIIEEKEASSKKKSDKDNPQSQPQIEVENKVIELIFESFEDFEPLSIVKKIDFLNVLYEEKKTLGQLKIKSEIASVINSVVEKILLDENYRNNIKTQATAGDGEEINSFIINHNFFPEDQKSYLCTILLNYIDIIEKSKDQNYTSFKNLYNHYIINIDNTISYYLNKILHDSNFQKLEGTWRGLVYLLSNSIITDNMRIKVFNASADELFNDLTKAMEFDQSLLFKKVYEAEYGTFGGNPYTCMMFDYYLTSNYKDMTLLRKMTEVMAAAHCPLFMGVNSVLFGIKNYSFINEPYSISSLFDSAELIEYKNFRESPDAKYANLLLPRILSRVPYNSNILSMDILNFIEEVSGINDQDYTWMNAAYAYVCQIANSYAMYGWFTTIVGVENGGKVENLPLYIYKNSNGESVAKCPTEVAITDRREKELSNFGFIALCNAKNENYSVFFGSNNTFKPPLFTNSNANANGDLSSRTPYMLNVSRIAHYLKCMMRDKVGSFMTADNVKKFISSWLAQYTLLNDDAPGNLKSEYPIREFNVKVDDVPGKPGQYNTIILLRPHNQLQAIEISLRLVAQLPK